MARAAGRTKSNQSGVNGGAPAATLEPKPEAGPPGPPFFDRLREMEEGDWDGHQVYVYRRWPRISKNDQPHYLEVVRHPVDEQYLLEHHGSGRYSLRLNDKRRTIASHVAEVHNLEHPPKVKPEELVDCPENERYFALWPAKREGGKAAAAGTGDGVGAAAVKEIGAIARQAQDKTADPVLAELYLKTAEARDSLVSKLAESKQKPDAAATAQVSLVNHVLDLVERLQKDKLAAAPTPAPSTTELVSLVREIAALVRPSTPAEKPASALSQLKDLAETVKSLRETFGPPASAEEATPVAIAGEASTWERIGGMLVSVLQPAMPSIGAAIAQKFITGGPAVAAPVALPQPAADVGQPSPAPAPNPAPEAAPPEDAIFAGLLRQAAPLILSALSQGSDGYAFADGLIMLHGRLAYEQIAAIGPERIIGLARSDPGFWGHVASMEARFVEFIQQFCRYDTWVEEQERQQPEAEQPPRRQRKPAAA